MPSYDRTPEEEFAAEIREALPIYDGVVESARTSGNVSGPDFAELQQWNLQAHRFFDDFTNGKRGTLKGVFSRIDSGLSLYMPDSDLKRQIISRLLTAGLRAYGPD